MKKTCIVLLICLSLTLLCGCAPKQYTTVVASRDVIGCGGYGAVFNAKIDPFDGNNFAATCDMGSVFFSFDKGKSWIRHNLEGTLFCLQYDTATPGVVWAAGSGIYKSTDHGKTIQRVFPKQEQITSDGNNYENNNYWIYTDKQSDYAPQYQIWSMTIDRSSNGQRVFAAQRVSSSGFGYNQCVRIYRTENGEDFSLFCEMPYSYNFHLDYDEHNDCLVFVTETGISEINSNGEVVCTINQPITIQFRHGNNIAFASCYNAQEDSNTFVFASPVTQEHVESACYKTTNLRDQSTYQDLTAELCTLTTDEFGVTPQDYNKGRPSYEYCEWVGNKMVPQQFKWKIVNMTVQDEDNIYIFHESNTPYYDEGGTQVGTRRIMNYLRYTPSAQQGRRFDWVYGNPLKPYDKAISNLAWQDSDSNYCFGLSSSPQNGSALLYCSNVGIYYTEDGVSVKQLNSTIFGNEQLTAYDNNGNSQTKSLQRLTSTGMDVICTHTLVTDPFDSNHLLMGCTDIGILQSYDNGNSWYHALYEWKDGELENIRYASYTNTCFDIHFDKYRKNVVYGLWSHEKTAPQETNAAYLTNDGYFGVSYDGGISWTMTTIVSGGCLPYRMQVQYDGTNPIIYVTTDSHGFFVTRDVGATFTSMNDGLDVCSVNGQEAIWGNELLVCEMGIFATTGSVATDSTSQGFYKWNNSKNKFEKIALPTCTASNGRNYTPAAIRDIEYDSKNNCLYLACTANVVNNNSKLEKTAGGIWKYQNGIFTQMYDPTRSVSCVKIDSNGTLYATEFGWNLLRLDGDNWTIVCEGMFQRIKNITFGTNDDTIYVATWGGGVERIVLKKVKQ